MRDRAFYFELHDLLIQFIAAFDDVTIGRHNKEREEKEQIKVRYLHAPKERVMQDIVNKAQNITLPVISVNMTSIQRDENRVFNKIMGMDVPIHNNGSGKLIQHIGMPVPVNVTVSMNILAGYQSDLDQIISNFVPYSNPYVIISWKIPSEFGLDYIKEIRSEVLWDGNISYEYPTDLESTNKCRFIATTSFVIKGWLFPEIPKEPSKLIYFIDGNFHVSSKKLLETLDYSQLSADNYVYDPTKGLLNETESVHISAVPQITNVLKYNDVKPYDITLDSVDIHSDSARLILLGKMFQHTDTVLISSNSVSYGPLTSLSYTYYDSISGYILPKSSYTIVGENYLHLNLPQLSGSGVIDIIVSDVVGWTKTSQLSTHLTYY